MQVHAVGPGHGLQQGREGHALARTRAVVQFEVGTLARQLARHGQHGRDAYAAGQQQMPRRATRMQREVVARCADGDLLAFLHLFVHGGRAAARGGLAQHADHVAARVLRVVAQRVLAHQAAGQVQVDVRAGREGGQAFAVQRHEFKAADVLRLGAFARDAHLEDGVGLHGKKSRKGMGSEKSGRRQRRALASRSRLITRRARLGPASTWISMTGRAPKRCWLRNWASMTTLSSSKVAAVWSITRRVVSCMSGCGLVAMVQK